MLNGNLLPDFEKGMGINIMAKSSIILQNNIKLLLYLGRFYYLGLTCNGIPLYHH